MPDDDYEDEEFETPEPAPRQRREPTPAEIRIWQKKAKQYDEAEPQLTKLQRENAVLRVPELSGLNERQRNMLMAGHGGDFSRDALLAEAQEAGWYTPEPQNTEPDPAEAAAHERMAAAPAGAQTPPKVSPVDMLLEADSEEEFWRRANAAGLAESS